MAAAAAARCATFLVQALADFSFALLYLALTEPSDVTLCETAGIGGGIGTSG